jgi:hypothetical protein
LEISLNSYSHLILTKTPKIKVRENTSSSTNAFEKTGYPWEED